MAFASARERLRGIQRQCQRMKISWSDVRVAVVARNNRQDARTILKELVDDPSPPDAIIAMIDELALGVLDIDQRRAAGSLGGDRHRLGRLAPAAHHDLTSVHQSLEEQGTLCALFVLGYEGQRETPHGS